MITLKIKDVSGNVLAQITDESDAQLVYPAEYNEGDKLCVECDEDEAYLFVQLEDTMRLSFTFLKNKSYELAVPFGEARTSYCPKSFTGSAHFLRARYACEQEIKALRNLCVNPYDCHANTTLFPHAYANVETRGEAVFAARNAIDGNDANKGHGVWPYESWGIQRREDAEFVVDFGREVNAMSIAITIRCDFPHDNYWQSASVEFSDGSIEVLTLEKKSLPQYFEIKPRTVKWAKLCHMKKDETDESPFPALSAFSIYGV